MPRGTRRTLGTGDAVVRSSRRRGNTNLSTSDVRRSGYDYEPSEYRSRKRTLFYAALCILVATCCIIFIARRSSGDDSSSSSHGRHHGVDPMKSFSLVSESSVPHVQADATMYKHTNTGMQVLTMKTTGQEDSTFGISFRTLPSNAHGTAHVVTQMLQSGSAKFPLKDAWNQIRHGSLQTHLEANTMKDRTEYVVSSRDVTDLSNSMQVMLDSFFNPNFILPGNSWSFRQEAWRLEQSSDGKNIFLKGKAYNQAKTDQMHPHEYMMHYVYKRLFVDTPIHYNERGDQSEILKMTYEEVVEFWTTFYHPSNAQAFCYGSSDEAIRVCLAELTLHLESFYPNEDEAKLIRDKTVVPYQSLNPNFARRDDVPYASYREDTDFRVVLSWVINDRQMDHVSQVAWMVIEDLLMGNSRAALANVVSEKLLGDDIIGRLERDYQQWVMMLGVSGIASELKVNEVVDSMNAMLLALASNGFPADAVEASMTKIEYQLLNQHAGDLPRGVDIFKKIMTNWNYDRNPTTALNYASHMKQLRDEVARSGEQYFLDLMTLHLIDNGHKLTLEMSPSVKIAGIYRDQEVDFLNQLKSLGKSNTLSLLDQATQLHDVLNTPDSPEDLAKIPRLSLEHVSTTGNEIPIEVDRDVLGSGLTVLEHVLPHTNNIGYVDYAIDVSILDFNDAILLPFYCQMSIHSGNRDSTPGEFVRRIDARTGGITVVPLIEDIVPYSKDNGYYIPTGQHLVAKLVISGNSAKTGSNSLFRIIADVLKETDFENEVVAEQLLRKLIDDMEDDIQENGHKYTTSRIESLYSFPGFVREQWYGVTQLYQLRKMLAELSAGNWSTLAQRMVAMRASILKGNRNGQFLSITADKTTMQAFTPSIKSFIDDGLPPIPVAAQRYPDFSTVKHPWFDDGSTQMDAAIASMKGNEAFVVPTRLSHVGEGGQVFDVGEKVHGADLAVTNFIGGFYLFHKLDREGAHDVSAIIDLDSGLLVYQSAEDPGLRSTTEIYNSAAEYVYGQINGSDELPVEIVAAMIGAVAAFDGSTPQPDTAGFISLVRFLKQETASHRQQIREEILATNKERVSAMTNRLGAWGNARTVVVTNQYFFGVEKESLDLHQCSLRDLSC